MLFFSYFLLKVVEDLLFRRLYSSVPSRVKNSRKMQNLWANFTDFEPEINIIKSKTEKLKKLEYFNARQ